MTEKRGKAKQKIPHGPPTLESTRTFPWKKNKIEAINPKTRETNTNTGGIKDPPRGRERISPIEREREIKISKAGGKKRS